MRWYSTVESADNLEFSLLAAVESLAAVSLSLWLAWKFQTATHILIAATLAPFLLLRSEKSTERGIKYFDWVRKGVREHLLFYISTGVLILALLFYPWFGMNITIGWIIVGLTSALLFFLGSKNNFLNKLPDWFAVVIVGGIGGVVGVGVAGSLLCKLSATIWTFIQSPINSLRNIPANWFRVVFCVDTRHPPELLPGLEHSDHQFRFGRWINDSTDSLQENDWAAKFGGGLFLLMTPLLFLPALAYRWSLKSSSIIWLPLIWIIGWQREHVSDTNRQLQIDLDVMRHTAWAKLMAAYSIIVIFLLTGLPLLLKGEAIRLKETLNPNSFNPMINNLIDYFLAFQMEAWHWSRLGASVLTLLLFFFADNLLRKRQYIEDAGLGFAPPFIRFVTLVRVPLSLFTIGCGLYLLISPIDWHEQMQNMLWLPFDWDWHKLLG